LIAIQDLSVPASVPSPARCGNRFSAPVSVPLEVAMVDGVRIGVAGLTLALVFALGVWVGGRPSPAQPAEGSAGPAADAPIAETRPDTPRTPRRARPVPAGTVDAPHPVGGVDVTAEGQTQEEVRDLVAQGEDAMERGDLVGATIAFQRVVEGGPDDPLAPFALYKLAWCHKNAGVVDEAIADLELLLQWAQTGDVRGGEPLVAEAKKDLERFRAE
jgi:hypothetical protein